MKNYSILKDKTNIFFFFFLLLIVIFIAGLLIKLLHNQYEFDHRNDKFNTIMAQAKADENDYNSKKYDRCVDFSISHSTVINVFCENWLETAEGKNAVAQRLATIKPDPIMLEYEAKREAESTKIWNEIVAKREKDTQIKIEK